MIPGNVIQVPGTDNAWYEAMKAREGWDKPIPIQFWYWLRNIFQYGTFGFSQYLRNDVSTAFFSKIPASISINLIPYVLSIPIAMYLGVTAALNKNKPIDSAISAGIMVFISIPFFVVAVLSQYVFHFVLKWAPSHVIATNSEFQTLGFWYGISTYILPVIVLTISSIPGLARSVRSELTEQLTQDYMLLARSKGLTHRQATYRHALKNAIAPFLPGIFIGVIGVMMGGMITERIFRVDGTGRIYLQAFANRDFPMLMLITVFTQFLSLVTSILADVSYTIFDPRVRFGSGKISE